MIQNEKGLTLIEILATLTLLSIIGVIIWQVFAQGYQFSNKAASKNRLQQEANLVITHLTRVHQTYGEYTINSSDGVIELFDSNSNPIAIFNNQHFHYHAVLIEDNETIEKKLEKKEVYPGKPGQDLLIKIKISEDERLSNSITMEAYLYRLKEDESFD